MENIINSNMTDCENDCVDGSVIDDSVIDGSVTEGCDNGQTQDSSAGNNMADNDQADNGNMGDEPAGAADEAQEAGAEAAEAEEQLTEAEQLARLAAAYAALERQKQELEAQMLRLQADFDNFRRRTRAEKEEWQQNNTAAFCGELLPVIDNFGRALQALRAGEADPGHLAGVEMIARQLAELLAAKGVERIPALGEEFDPNWHEAIGQTVVEDEAMVGKVTEEIQAGYRLGSKLLRVAMVHVGTK